MNEVKLFGRLGQDPKLTTSGKMATFSVATGTKEKTQWHNVKVFNDLAARCVEFLRKGNRVLVSGSIEYSKVDDKHYTNIVGWRVDFIDRNEAKEQSSQQAGLTADDIPF